MKRSDLATLLMQGIHLLHLNGNRNFSNHELANTVGISTSTVKRNKKLIEVIETALILVNGGKDV